VEGSCFNKKNTIDVSDMFGVEKSASENTFQNLVLGSFYLSRKVKPLLPRPAPVLKKNMLTSFIKWKPRQGRKGSIGNVVTSRQGSL